MTNELDLFEGETPFNFMAESTLDSMTIFRKVASNYEKASVLKGHDMLVKAIVNDGADTVVSGGWDGRVIMWKASSGEINSFQKFSPWARRYTSN